MALATKCPHCNTVFRVAHDQLKLRGGIVRCGSCNEVFDGNAALLEPPTPLPVSPLPAAIPFDQKMAALDTRAAEVLAVEEAEPVLDLDTLDADDIASADLGDDDADTDADAAADIAAATDQPPPAVLPEPEPQIEPEPEPEIEPEPQSLPQPETPADFADPFDDEPTATPTPFPLPAAPATLPAAPATLPADREALFDLDLDMESEPDLEASIEPEVAAVPITDDALTPVDNLSDDELEAALEAELAVMEQSLADIQHDGDALPATDNGRREPTWDDPTLEEEPQAGGGPALERAFAAADDAIFSAEAQTPADDNIDADLASFGSDAPAQAAPQPAPASRPLRDDELDEVDEEALVQLSHAGMSQAQAAPAHTYLHAVSAEEAPAHEDHAEPEEPGFVKRDRLRRKYGKATSIAFSLGSLLLVLALLGQAVTTFRNALAAAMPPLKPALSAACNAIGCKIELPTQIDHLVIEQGELQTLSDTAFSFTTLLRNESRTAQAWPSIELTLDDANDKRILRRVFTPRDYLGADVAVDKGFAPHTEQAVKLYFELRELKASGYHIAVFYP